MKKICYFILLCLFYISLADADIIYLKGGRKINVGDTWKDGDLIKCKIYGGIVGFEKKDIIKIEKERANEPIKKRSLKREDSSPFSVLVSMVERSMGFSNEIENLHYSRALNKISELELIGRMQKLCPEINAITMKSGDLLFPPDNIKAYDQITLDIFNKMNNICLYYSEKGLEKWSGKNRKMDIKKQIESLKIKIRRPDFVKKRILKPN